MSAYPPGALEQVQQIQTDILKVISEICDELNLTWFGDSGTCLGAIRHNGFIPWDDDIDIGLPIGDYKKFCELAPQILEGSTYGVYTYAATPNYPPLFTKVYKRGTRFIGEQMLEAGFNEGIFVDVFAYAQLDSSPCNSRQQIRQFLFWQRISYLRELAHPYYPKPLPAIARPFISGAMQVGHAVIKRAITKRTIENNFFKVLERGDQQGPWVSIFYPHYGEHETKTLFPVSYHEFEGMQIPLPHDPHIYLVSHYGDYMCIPSESDRFLKPPVILDFGNGVNVMEQVE